MMSNSNLPFISIEIPDSLNFALLIRYKFIEPFPIRKKDVFIKKHRRLFNRVNLRNQKQILVLWNRWWHDLLQKRAYINQNWQPRYDIDLGKDFSSISHLPELQELCSNTWEEFSDWWYSAKEGRMALRNLEEPYDFSAVFENLENDKRLQQENLRPFSQYLDFIFGYVDGINDVNNCYTLINITDDIPKDYLNSLILNKICRMSSALQEETTRME